MKKLIMMGIMIVLLCGIVDAIGYKSPNNIYINNKSVSLYGMKKNWDNTPQEKTEKVMEEYIPKYTTILYPGRNGVKNPPKNTINTPKKSLIKKPMIIISPLKQKYLNLTVVKKK